jgi:hypothetical protein
MEKVAGHVFLIVTKVRQLGRWKGFSCAVSMALEDVRAQDSFCTSEICQRQRGNSQQSGDDSHCYLGWFKMKQCRKLEITDSDSVL